MAEVRMPKMGDGMEEGTITAWLVKEGDVIKSGDVIAEIETDKANVEITSYESGKVSKLLVLQGQTVPVGTAIALVGEGAAAGNGAAVPAPQRNDTPGNKVGGEEGTPAPTLPKEPNGAGPELRHVPGEERPLDASELGHERVKASPLVRSMAKQQGVDLAQIAGSGPGGRIVKRDFDAFLAKGGGAKPLPSVEVSPSRPEPARSAPPAPVAGLEGEETTPSKMRQAIAKRTVQSKQNVPHFYVTMVVEMDRALALLKELNADATDGKVTVNDIIVKACAIALGRVPEVNATWTPDNKVRRYKEAHIGVAVGIDEGLIIPVVRDCHAKTLRQISAEAKSLIKKARENKLTPEEYSGGTFSVSNLGMMGVDEFIAIINPPEAAILAIGGVVREPVVVGDTDEIVIRSRMKITISADHRLLDGVVAARFVQEVKKVLEAPFSLLS